MGSAQRNDWDEKTVINQSPATRFAAQEASRERQGLVDLFDDGDLEATRVRNVPSEVLRVAANAESTLEVSTHEVDARFLEALPEPPLSGERNVAQPDSLSIESAPASIEPSRSGASLAAAILAGILVALFTVATTVTLVAAYAE